MSSDGTESNVTSDHHEVNYDITSEGEEDEDDDDDDDNDNNSPNLVRLLNEFRLKWQQELGMHEGDNNSNFADNRSRTPTKEDMARAIFKQGINAEQAGRLTEAVGFYRRAIQMVPDIEAKIDYRNLIPQRDRNESESSIESTENDDVIHDYAKRDDICHPAYDQRKTHISALPIELMMIILKWVISDDLDLSSLEMVSMVCRAWYRYARDEELWKLVCTSQLPIEFVDGNEHENPQGSNPGSLEVYFPHLLYVTRVLANKLELRGVYISKSSYLRQGEKGVYDIYNPWHIVDYYRYIRFFPDGEVLMLTSPEDPICIVSKLRSRDSARQGLLKGFYKMTGSTMTAVFKRVKNTIVKPVYRFRRYRNNNQNHVDQTFHVDSTIVKPVYRFRRYRNNNQNHVDQTFHVEFSVVSSGKRQCCRLLWTKYMVRSCRSSGETNESEFELTPKNYPPLFFSSVKSYTALSRGPLQ